MPARLAVPVDAASLETRVKHITDGDLLSALRLDVPELDAVRAAAGSADTIGEALRDYVLAFRGRRSLPWAVAPEGAAADEARREADLIVRRDIKCWCGVRIRYRGEVDFSRNLPGSSNYGFHYFGWIVPLAGAWRATGDERYARAFVEIFSQWYRQRDLVRGDFPRFDVIWYELGTGARMPVFTDLYFATLDSQAARGPGYHQDLWKTALGHGRWLHEHETAFQPGNFQITASRALLLIGLAFPELREARRWVLRGAKYLLAHVARDVYADGCHKERAPHYHLGVARNFASAAELATGVSELAAGRRELEAAARRMLRWTAGVMTPTRHSPAVGDSEYDVPREQFLHDGAHLRDPLLLWASGASAREIAATRRRLGVGAIGEPRPPAPGRESADLVESGFVVVRSGWKSDDLWFLLNYGPWGGGHSHAEALAFQLWCNGSPLAVDCGRGVNYDDPLHRVWYVTPHAHNMVVVDGTAPSVKGRRGRLLFHTRAAGVHLIGLEHAGYREQGVRHRRCLLVSTRRRYLVVLDFLRADGEHSYEWVVNTPVPGVRTGSGRAWGPGLTVLCADPGLIEEVRAERVRMCLPREGGSTWGLPRGRGTNVRFGARGGTVGLHFLLVPVDSPEGVRFAAERVDSRSPYRLALTVAAPGFEDRYVVDCARGVIRPV